MTRPVDPNWTVEPFAPDTNYAVGALPWSGTPTKVPWAGAASVGFEPKGGVPAPCVNYVLNQHADALIKIKTWADEVNAYVAQVPALNFKFAALGFVSPNEARFARFVRKTESWWVVGDSGHIAESQDNGNTWSSSQLGHGGDPATEDFLCLDAAPDGSMVISTNTRYVYAKASEFDPESYIDVFATDLDGSSAVVYDAAHSAWICALSDAGPGSAGLFIRTSPDRATWTAQTVPSGSWGALGSELRMLVNPASGRVTLLGLNNDGLSLVRSSHSDDGGVTWSATTSLDTSVDNGGSSKFFHAAYDADGLLMLTVSSETVGTVYTSSDDGATWTVAAHHANSSVRGPVSLGGMWIAIGSEESDPSPLYRSFVVYSLDDGATWQRAGFTLTNSSTTPRAFFADTIGGALALDWNGAFVSLRTGTPGLGALT